MPEPQKKRIDIQIKDGGQPLAEAPLIDGCNLFTGDYKGPAHAGFTTSSLSWEEMWDFLGAPPPGPLPQGAQAVLEAEGQEKGGVCYRPQKVVQKDDGICISWERAEVPKDEAVQKTSRYAVLVLPKGTLTAQFQNVFPAEQRREKARALEAQEKSILMGPPVAIKPLRPIRFKD